MEIEELLGLDVGKARTGVARASTHARLAEPLTTLRAENVYVQLRRIVDEYKSDALVVGLPTNSQGDDTEQTRWVRKWVVEAKRHIDKPFYWQDEELSTKMAETRQLSEKKPIHDSDAIAAAIILQDFLESPETGRRLC
jgi:putative Holliday junction resolvase